MSLIAEALKKAEAAPPEKSPIPNKSTAVYRLTLLGCVVLVLLGIERVTRRPTPEEPPQQQAASTLPPAPAPVEPEPPPSPQAVAPPAPAPVTEPPSHLSGPELLFKGTLQDSSGKTLALINREIVQQGDRVREMTVVRVSPDSVELQDESGKTKTLRRLEN